MGKVIWITGASSGFGKAVAETLLEYTDHIVCVSARRIEKLKTLEERGAYIYPVDVTSEEQIKRATEYIIREHQQIDAVLVNAGYGVYGAIESVERKDLVNQFEVNVFGAVDTIKQVLPHMRSRHTGRIVITSSTAAHITSKGTGVYSSTKHSIKALGTALRQETKPFGIDVVMVEPGIVKTDFKESALNHSNVDELDSPYQEMHQDLKRYMMDAFNRAPEMKKTKDIMVYALLNDKVKPVYRMNFITALQNNLVHLIPAGMYDKIASLVIKRL
jgi:NADP-dependent 3-hydroxy acid dehydrogenase YdfG